MRGWVLYLCFLSANDDNLLGSMLAISPHTSIAPVTLALHGVMFSTTALVLTTEYVDIPPTRTEAMRASCEQA